MKARENAWCSRLCSAILTALVIFSLIFALIYILQNQMIFHHVMDQNSREFLQGNSDFYEVKFVAENGITHHGVMRLATNEKAPLVIYFGGNGEVSYRHMRTREILRHWPYFAGYHYLFIDYQGYGLNSGRTHYRNMYETALAAFEYAVAHPSVASEQIVVMGYSLGTGSAIYLAANRSVAGLILLTPYANGYDLYNNVLPIFHGPLRWLVRQKLPSDQYAPMISAPVLIIASRDDEIIPFASAKELAALFAGEVTFMELSGVLHNDVFIAEGVLASIQAFLAAVLEQT